MAWGTVALKVRLPSAVVPMFRTVKVNVALIPCTGTDPRSAWGGSISRPPVARVAMPDSAALAEPPGLPVTSRVAFFGCTPVGSTTVLGAKCSEMLQLPPGGSAFGQNPVLGAAALKAKSPGSLPPIEYLGTALGL